MDYHKVLPFYMTYPLPLFYEDEDKVIRDLEYLQQMYPQKAKCYQTQIAQILDTIDYDGSLIYDEFPDRLQLYKLCKDIYERIIKEEALKEETMMDTVFQQHMQELNKDKDEDEKFILVQIILYYEIYKRRQDGRKGFLKF